MLKKLLKDKKVYKAIYNKRVFKIETHREELVEKIDCSS